MEVLKIEICFDGSRVEKYFFDYNLIKKKIGDDKARALKKLMNLLNNAECFREFIILSKGKPHSLSGDLFSCYKLNIDKNYRLIIKPITDDNSTEALHKCKMVQVKGVVDYHGSNYSWLIP